MYLSEIKAGNKVKIKKISCDEKLKRRLYDLGFVPKETIECVFINPFKSPMAFKVKECVIALRKKDITEIEVEE